MALFKILRGPSSELKNLPINDGWCYFTPDTGLFHIDYNGNRVPLNAADAATLSGASLVHALSENGSEVEIPSTALLAEISDNLIESIAGKQDIVNGSEGQLVGFDAEGKMIAVDSVEGSQGIVDQNTGELIKIWYGTTAEYDLIETKDDSTIYIISDEESGDITADAIQYYNGISGLAATDVQSAIDEVYSSINNIDHSAYSTATNLINGDAIGSLQSIGASSGIEENYVIGNYAFAIGHQTKAEALYSHAEGSNTRVLGTGYYGMAGHTEGVNTEASNGFGNHAEGYGTVASGTNGAHAEGYATTAAGNASHAEGYGTVASGTNGAHAEGYATTAAGNASHAEGQGTVAASMNQHVEGRYNLEDTSDTYIHITGNGKNANFHSNAHTIDWEGNAWFAGDVYTGFSNGTSQDGTNRDEGSKKLATEEYVETQITALNLATTYEPIGAETRAKAYADTAASDAATAVKNDLLNNAGEAYDTLKELGDLIDENTDAIEALNTVAAGKQDKLVGTENQIVSFDANGNVISKDNIFIAPVSVTEVPAGSESWTATSDIGFNELLETALSGVNVFVELNETTCLSLSKIDPSVLTFSYMSIYNNFIQKAEITVNSDNQWTYSQDYADVYTKAEVDALFANMYTKAEVDAAIAAAIEAAFANIARAEETSF